MEVFNNIKDYFIERNDDLSAYSDEFNILPLQEMLENEVDGVLDDKYTAPHKRDFFEIALIKKISEPSKIADHSFSGLERCLGAISPFQVVSYGNGATNHHDVRKMEGFVIYFKPTFFASLHQAYEIQSEFPFFKIHTSPFYKLSPSDLEETLAIANNLYLESKDLRMNSTEILRSLLLVLLYKIKRITLEDTVVINVNRFESMLARFETLIQSGKNKFYAVHEYAEQMNISSIYLSECVKKASGKTAQQVIIEYKLIYAQTMLLQVNKSISEIGYELGFSEVSNFTKFFKRNKGITPKQFRNKKGMG